MSTRHDKLLDEKPLPEIADFLAKSAPNSPDSHVARAEFLLREAQFAERQALAAEETMRQTARYTKYMFWSVTLLAVSVISSIVFEFIRLYR